MQKGKMAEAFVRPEEALQIAEKRKAKGKGKISPFECRAPRNSKDR